MFILGFIIFLLGTGFFIILLGGQVSNFRDVASLLIIVVSMVAVLTATQSFKLFYKGLMAAIFPKEDISERMCVQAIALFRLLSKTVIMAST